MSPDEVCCLLSSAHEDISKRCQYLDFSLVGHFLSPLSPGLSGVSRTFQNLSVTLDMFVQNSAVQDSAVLSAHPKSRRQVRVSTQTGSLQLSRTGVDLHEDPVVGVVRSERISAGS